MDIIVMGTLGKTGFERLLPGSVAGNVLRHLKIPVMVVEKI
jgi:nucleotide-binding universal stress UspA family protein